VKQTLQGPEQWTFSNINGKWLISTLIYSLCLPDKPPPTSVVTSLMDQEAQAALTHDLGIVSKIFSPNAVVVDDLCQSPNLSKFWHGLQEIQDRYDKLPTYISLQHVNSIVTWIPDDSSAAKATATAETDGVYVNSSGKRIFIRGYELWTFAKIDGKWLITSFAYDRCPPP
jgi:hypothetical protein